LHERRRRDGSPRGVLPASQRLAAEDLAGREVADRLVDHRQLAALDRRPQVRLQVEAVAAGVALAAVERDGAPRALRPLESLLGALQQAVELRAVAGEE